MRVSALVTSFGVLVAFSGCGSGTSSVADSGVECDGRGRLVGASCQCDVGFESPAGDTTRCVAVESTQVDGGPADAGTPAMPVIEDVTFVATQASARYATTHGGGKLWAWTGVGGQQRLQVEIYTEFGGPEAPGPFPLRVDDASYATCGACVVYRRGCSSNLCAEIFMPVVTGAEVVTFSTLGTLGGQTFSGSTTSMLLQQVTIDPQSYVTTPVVNGKRVRLVPAVWNTSLPAPECGGRGHLHGSTCHCDPGYRVDPSNPANCIP